MKKRIGWSFLAFSVLGGCADVPEAPPKAAISDVAVFSALHLLAAEAGSTNLIGPFTAAQMDRHFETLSTDYNSKKANADTLLDQTQSQTAFFQAAQSQLAASIAVAASPAPKTGATTAPTDPAAATPATASAAITQMEADAKSAFAAALAASPNDSPFDHLDRVADFYAAYVIKNLRVRNDSRAIDPQVLENLLLNLLPDGKDKDAIQALVTGALTHPIANSMGDRMILLVFQAQVDAGNQPDKWVGVRLTLTNPNFKTAGFSIDDIHLIRVHPTHTYDVDLQTFGSASSAALALAAQGSAAYGGIGASGNVSNSASEEAEERRRYLSRTSKITSFADAANQMVGFNFYPSNVKVVKTGNWFGNPYDTHGYLEGGARDCAVMMVVPRSLHGFDLQVTNVRGDMNVGKEEQVALAPGQKNTVHVTLPDWDPLECIAATIGAGPTPSVAPVQVKTPTADPSKPSTPAPAPVPAPTTK